MELTADRTERSLTVEVTDQGTGIKDIKKAMEPMYTTDRSGERSGMGFAFMEAFMAVSYTHLMMEMIRERDGKRR